MRCAFSSIAALACAGLLALTTASTTSAQNATGAVTVSGNALLRDRAVWVSHGVVSIAFVAPPAAQSGVFLSAYQHFSTDELAAMKAWGADTVRMQVSQPGLDPQNSLYTTDFVTAVKNGVLNARAAGLNVIVSVQDESQSGQQGASTPLPNDATRRVWQQVLAPLFNGDQGILYEMMNEPQPAANAANWAAWADAMNAVIAVIRQTGSKNVVVADGLEYAERLDGAPALTDPLNQVAYASHPYFHSADDQTPQAWDTKFGNFAQTAPVIVTEWTTIPNSPSNSYYSDANTAQAALNFIRYLAARGIGLSAYAYDFSGNQFGSVVHGFNGVPSTFAGGLQPGDADYGPGALVQQWYRTGEAPFAFFTDEQALTNGVYYLAFPNNGDFFGYYAYLSDPRYVYHFDLGYEYTFGAADGKQGIYFYDFKSGHFFYTSPTFPFPYLYDFSLSTVLYYFPDPNNTGRYTSSPRYFYNFASGQVISM
ncbi:MAG: cellulase family glycosylhydrolase [Rhodospirillales bacterium]|nr:cellulase family glycosylhydrolase [Acetobacter sp.]